VRIEIDITAVACFSALGQCWDDLAAVASPSFFQSWTWIGCLAEERYADPFLVRASADGRLVGMALFNRHRGRLCLAEAGRAELDSPYIEHNAPLLASDAPKAALRAVLRSAWQVKRCQRLLLHGVPPEIVAAAGGVAFRSQERLAPFVDLDAIRAGGGRWLQTLSANARYQLRRSAKHYAAHGEITLARPGDLEHALGWFEAMVALHDETWRRRGQAGAFATPFAQRFHRTLIARAIARNELDLLRISAGDFCLGYLYNFRSGRRVYAYQSGFNHAAAGPHGKPGLTCHALAIERALAAGDQAYDFLAGADRYKLSLSNAAAKLLWVEAVRPWSPRGLLGQLRRAIDRTGLLRGYSRSATRQSASALSA